MKLHKFMRMGWGYLRHNLYKILDFLFVRFDRVYILRSKNIRLIPNEPYRRGGKYSYAEWGHVIGIFQTFMSLYLQNRENNNILDVGCGTGLLAISSEPFLGEYGKYVGIDVVEKDVRFCRKHYPSSNFEFIHLDANNPAYTSSQKSMKLKWPIESESIDLVTALSVWTHLKEEDSLFYFNEMSRVLKPDGIAIVTFFLLDKEYEKSCSNRTYQMGRYHMTSQARWIFDQSSYGSDAWLNPKWATIPEQAIGITKAGLDRLISGTDLTLIEHFQGNWKEIPGAFFQDILIFEKLNS